MIARDFEQLTSITGSAPHSLLYLPAVRAYTRARARAASIRVHAVVISLILEVMLELRRAII